MAQIQGVRCTCVIKNPPKKVTTSVRECLVHGDAALSK